MPGRGGTVTLTVVGSVQSAVRGLQQLQKQGSSTADRLKSGFRGVGTVFTGVFAAGAVSSAPQMINDLVNSARNLELQGRKVDIVFGEFSGTVERWAEANAHALGLTSREAQIAAASTADLLIPMGFGRDIAVDMSTQMVNLSGALSEWSGGSRSATEVSDILTKALLGERDGLKALGISISEADVQARLAANGQAELTGQALEQAKAQATLELILGKSTDAQNAFAEGSGSSARAAAEAAAAFREMKEDLATGLLPVVTTVQGFVASKFIPTFQSGLEVLKPLFRFVIENKVAMVAAILAIGFAVITALGPVSGAVVAVTAFITGLGWLRDNWDQVRATAQRFIEWIDSPKGAAILIGLFGPAGAAVVALVHFRDQAGQIFGWVRDRIRDVINIVQELIEKIKAIPKPDLGFIGDAGGAIGGALGRIPGFATGGVVPGPRGRARLVVAHGGETILPTHRGGGGGYGQQVVVQVTQPLASAEQIATVVVEALEHARRTGRIPA